MDTHSLPLVPFGKYKGQPITRLINDPATLDYYKKQKIIQNYPFVNNICVNQTITPNNENSKTPEHNKLQNLFLERNFNIEFINNIFEFDKSISLLNKLYDTEDYKKYFGEQKFNENNYGLENSLITSIFETKYNWDVRIFLGEENGSITINENTIKLNSTYYKEKLDIRHKLFNGINHIDCHYGYGDCEYYFADIRKSLYIEIKPLLGDDYPNVLRKMTTQKNITNDRHGEYVLFIGEYASSYTTKKQLIQIFKQSNIRVMFICDLFDNSQSKIIAEQVEKVQDIIIQPTSQQELEEENKLLRKKLFQAEEKNKQLEKEILSLKSQQKGKSKSIKDYFGKK